MLYKIIGTILMSDVVGTHKCEAEIWAKNNKEKK